MMIQISDDSLIKNKPEGWSYAKRQLNNAHKESSECIS